MWTDLIAWFQSADAPYLFAAAGLVAVAILLAGVITGAITRNALLAMARSMERQSVTATVAAVADAARRAEDWPKLGEIERRHVVRLSIDSVIRLRLLPRRDSAKAAAWAELVLERIVRAEQPADAHRDAVAVRDRLADWLTTPKHASRLFDADIARFGAERAAAPQTSHEPTAAAAAPSAEPSHDGAALSAAEASERARHARNDVAPDSGTPKKAEPGAHTAAIALPVTPATTVAAAPSGVPAAAAVVTTAPAAAATLSAEPEPVVAPDAAPPNPSPFPAASTEPRPVPTLLPSELPERLDDYDDDADITEDDTTGAPAPVPAAAVRARIGTDEPAPHRSNAAAAE